MLGGAACLVALHYAGSARHALARRGVLPKRRVARVDLSAWTPPDSSAAREAERFLREVSSPEMVQHSFRTYYFSCAVYASRAERPPLDRETLFVAALLHDVGLFVREVPVGDHCFTVSSAREARRIAQRAGWDAAREDRMALAITTNLNPFVSAARYGSEAHFMRAGGLVEVLAQSWAVHPDTLAEILSRHPREGFAEDALSHVRSEVRRNPGCRFARLDPLFPFMVRRGGFDAQ